jgi:hypothetical protein
LRGSLRSGEAVNTRGGGSAGVSGEGGTGRSGKAHRDSSASRVDVAYIDCRLYDRCPWTCRANGTTRETVRRLRDRTEGRGDAVSSRDGLEAHGRSLRDLHTLAPGVRLVLAWILASEIGRAQQRTTGSEIMQDKRIRRETKGNEKRKGIECLG